MKTSLLFTLALSFFGVLCFSQNNDDITYTRVQVYPVLEGCGNSEAIALRECFEMSVARHVADNFSYTEEARKANVKGTITISFIVDKEGNIVEPSVSKGISGNYSENETQMQQALLLEKNALASIDGLKIEKPAMQAGKPVRFKYSFPIEASLE